MTTLVELEGARDRLAPGRTTWQTGSNAMNCINGTLARLQLSRLSYKSCKGDYLLQRRVVAGSYNHAGCKTRLQCTHTLICTKEVKKAIQQLLARSSPSGSKTIKV